MLAASITFYNSEDYDRVEELEVFHGQNSKYNIWCSRSRTMPRSHASVGASGSINCVYYISQGSDCAIARIYGSTRCVYRTYNERCLPSINTEKYSHDGR